MMAKLMTMKMKMMTDGDDDSNRLRWSSVAQVGPSSGHTWSNRSAE